MKVYNSLTKKIEDFEPLDTRRVTMYTCGPTVYSYPQIGNWRTYVFADFLYRALTTAGYNTYYVMNLTDVGHLTGDNAGDADVGEDRLESAAEREGKSSRAIADYYIEDFMKGFSKLNMTKPAKFTRATDYINEQIGLIRRLEERGYVYKIDDGLYFDTSKFKNYGSLSGMDEEGLLEGTRVEPNPNKKNPADFALWKFSPKDQKRWQEWQSPWGIGFPGWHIECSAMSMKELGDTIDLHLGGEDLKMIHHQNEIAQSEAATGKLFVKYWMHGAFLQVDGGRMGKSLGNAYTIADIENKGYDPLALRYFYTTAHYRSKLNFTWEALANAQNALKKIYDIIEGYKEDKEAGISDKYMTRFNDALGDDLNIPQAVSILWEMLKGDLPEAEKLATAVKMDEVLGFKVEDHVGYEIPQKIVDMANTRVQYRKAGIWDKADVLRREINSLGYIVEDISAFDYKLKRKS